MRVTTNPVSDYHTDATPFWRAGLPAVYAATKDHRIYQHWHGTTPPTRPSVHRRLRHLLLLRHPAGPHDTLAELGGELGADSAVMATSWLASHAAAAAPAGELERRAPQPKGGAAQATGEKRRAPSSCFSHFAEGSLQEEPRPFQMAHLSVDAALEKAHHALGALQANDDGGFDGP